MSEPVYIHPDAAAILDAYAEKFDQLATASGDVTCAETFRICASYLRAESGSDRRAPQGRTDE